MRVPASAAVPALTILFFLFFVIGWLMEVVLKWIQYGRFINRGFLIGPYCPIYGSGVVVITVLVGGLQGREGTVGETFLAGLLVCGTLEYLVSWYMEKLFHARWWDYSHKPMNLNGRIWIGNLVLFGLASVVIVKGIDPFAFRVLLSWPPVVLHVLAVCCALLLLIDAAVSHFLMNLVQTGKVAGMSMNEPFFGGALQVIRPLMLISKAEIVRAARQWELPVFANPCPSAGKTKRADMMEVLDAMCAGSRVRRKNIYNGLARWQWEQNRLSPDMIDGDAAEGIE